MLLHKPKENFQRTINLQNAYIELLKKQHNGLAEICKDGEGYEKLKNDVDLYELAVKLDAQISLFKEKLSHYQDIFIKPYDEELKECEENFESTWEQSLQYISDNLEKNTEVCNNIKSKTESYLALEEAHKNHIEVKNVLYKDLKVLFKLTK